jgi:hypothetical protein
MENYRTCFDPRDVAVVTGIAPAALVTLPGVTGDNRVGRPGINLANATGNAYTYSSLPNQATQGVHLALYVTSLTGNIPAIALTDGTNSQLILQIGSTGMLTLYAGDGTTVLGTSGANLISTNRWYSIEWSATISSTVGASIVQVNTVPWITLSGINTQTTTHSYVNGFKLSASWYATDIVAWDSTGTTNNTFYGDCRVDWIAPSGASPTLSGFTSFTGGASDPSGTLYQAATTGSTALLTTAAPPTLTGSIKSVTTNLQARKTDNSLAMDVLAMVGTSASGTLATETSSALGTNATWNYYSYTFPTRPDGSAWTTADLAALQFGAKTL